MAATRVVPQDAPTLASDAELTAHAADTTAIHGIADTSALSTTAHDHDADYEAAGGIATHSADSTAVHGITDTAALVVDGDAAGGELAGTYPSPTVASSHAGGTHAATQAAAEATAAGALSGHAAAGDPHVGYRLESADHSHATTGLQAGTVAHTALTSVGIDDHHARDHAINGATHTGTLDDAQIPAGITRDAEAAAAYQPLDSDLTAIAALSTTAFGRGLLALADAAALSAAHSHSGASTLYAPGSFTVATGNYMVMSKGLQLTTTQRVTLQGTARLRIT